MIRTLLTKHKLRIAARRLSKRAHEKQHIRIIERARQMRRELNLPPSPALET